MSNWNVISRSKVVIFFALFLFVGDSEMVTAQDEPVCDSWQLQGFWIGMPKQVAPMIAMFILYASTPAARSGTEEPNRSSL